MTENRPNRICVKCNEESLELFCLKCQSMTYSKNSKIVNLKQSDDEFLKPFEEGWESMCIDLKEKKNFLTTGSNKTFKAWYPCGDKISYLKSTGEQCDLTKSEFMKAYITCKKTKELHKTGPYSYTKHGSYYPPLLKKYFIKN